MKSVFTVVFLVAAVGWILLSVSDGQDSSYASESWHRGYSGLQDATQSGIRNQANVVVYIYTDWCGYCRILEKEFLYDEEISAEMADVVKVRMNPELDADARKFMASQGAEGYPTLLIKRSGRKEFENIYPFSQINNEWVLREPEELLSEIQN